MNLNEIYNKIKQLNDKQMNINTRLMLVENTNNSNSQLNNHIKGYNENKIQQNDLMEKLSNATINKLKYF